MRTVSTLRRIFPPLLSLLLLSPAADLAAQTSATPAQAPSPEAPGAPDATQDPPPSTLVAEVARLNETLERIAELLASQADTQQIDLGMKRLEMLTARLERSERELRGLRSTRSSLETERIAMEEQRAQAELQRESLDAEEGQSERARAFFRQIDRQLERVREELGDTERQIVEIENQTATQRRDLAAWQDFVDRRLGGL